MKRRNEIDYRAKLNRVLPDLERISQAPVVEYDNNLYKAIDRSGTIYTAKNPNARQSYIQENDDRFKQKGMCFVVHSKPKIFEQTEEA